MWCQREYNYRSIFCVVVILALGIVILAAYADHQILTSHMRD